jgi:hypothetical protein
LPCWARSGFTPPCCGGSDAMLIELIYGAAALVVAAYMVAALLRPDRF